jgi:hypothetical protein
LRTFSRSTCHFKNPKPGKAVQSVLGKDFCQRAAQAVELNLFSHFARQNRLPGFFHRVLKTLRLFKIHFFEFANHGGQAAEHFSASSITHRASLSLCKLIKITLCGATPKVASAGANNRLPARSKHNPAFMLQHKDNTCHQTTRSRRLLARQQTNSCTVLCGNMPFGKAASNGPKPNCRAARYPAAYSLPIAKYFFAVG